MRTQIHSALLVIACTYILCVPAVVATAQAATGDTLTAVQGAQAGQIAARRPEVFGRAMLGFVSGIPIGFSVPSFAYGGVGGVALGVAGIEAAGRLGDTAPSPGAEIQARGDAFTKAYIESYSTTLSRRRVGAARTGGVMGSVAGFGFLFFLLSHMTT